MSQLHRTDKILDYLYIYTQKITHKISYSSKFVLYAFITIEFDANLLQNGKSWLSLFNHSSKAMLGITTLGTMQSGKGPLLAKCVSNFYSLDHLSPYTYFTSCTMFNMYIIFG